MNVRFFDNRRVRQGLTILSLAGSLACIFPPQHPAFQWWAEHAVFVALGFVLLGLFFLIINKSRLMFVCLGCSAAICFFKNELSERAFESDRSSSPDALPDTPFQHSVHRDSFSLKSSLPDESSKTRQ
jgi:hypothetical protein